MGNGCPDMVPWVVQKQDKFQRGVEGKLYVVGSAVEIRDEPQDVREKDRGYIRWGALDRLKKQPTSIHGKSSTVENNGENAKVPATANTQGAIERPGDGKFRTCSRGSLVSRRSRSRRDCGRGTFGSASDISGSLLVQKKQLVMAISP